MITLTFATIFSVMSSLPVFSTPDSAVWENEILIGANDQNFYTIKMYKYLMGTYYANIDSVFLIEKAINNGEIIEKIVLRVVSNMDVTSEGDWQHTDRIENPINIIDYQKEKNIQLVYQRNFYDSKFSFSPQGLILNYRGSKELIVDRPAVNGFIDWFDQYIGYQETYSSDRDFRIRVSQAYESKTHVFLVVETGADQSDTTFKQSILVFQRDKLNSARQKINRLKN